MFSLNPFTFIKSELLKYKDKVGRPKVFDVIENIESRLLLVKQFLNRLDLQDIQAIFALLPPSTAAKFPPGELDAIAAGIAGLPGDIDQAEIELKKLETELEAK